ncbi:MAG: NAD(P)-dependent dehydrogenase (short-subunit alcohol dehydrogenase family) [Zhongshania sp.]|jgi:NAD(P)-dependent dehydrogenase (short-subunit alcohol dehydrogenase family)
MGSKRVFITGGASGLGRALANCFADAGYKVCIGDVDDGRGAEVLAELQAKTTAHYCHCDVTQESALQAAADWLKSEWGGVDVVINNAGVASAGSITEFPLVDWEWIMNINVLGVVRGCKVFATLMQEQGSGHLVNVASLAGLVSAPKMSSYCATKAAVVAISEVLSVELDQDNIAVSVVCPSFFRTNLADTARASDAASQAATQRLVNKAKLGADEIAARVFDSIQKREFYILPHPEGRSAWRLKRWLPYSRFRALMIKRTSKMMVKRNA